MNTRVLVGALPLLALAGAAWIPTASAAPASASRCTTAQLKAGVGPGDGAAGSVYLPIVWTNRSQTSCTLFGYPGASYVAPKTGKQVGTAATRNPQHPSTTVTLKPGGHASALVQLANYQNYPKTSCKATAVSGLRVYPPGSTSAEFVAFTQARKACSTSVHQLSVQATVAGKSGQ